MPAPTVELRPIPGEYVIAKLPATTAALPPELSGMHAEGTIVSITRTPQELSIVCPADLAPVDAEIDGPWTALYAGGPIPFGLTGVITSLVAPLSAVGCPVFVLSTFDGDILMVPSRNAAHARELLAAAGHTVSSGALSEPRSRPAAAEIESSVRDRGGRSAGSRPRLATDDAS